MDINNAILTSLFTTSPDSTETRIKFLLGTICFFVGCSVLSHFKINKTMFALGYFTNISGIVLADDSTDRNLFLFGNFLQISQHYLVFVYAKNKIITMIDIENCLLCMKVFGAFLLFIKVYLDFLLSDSIKLDLQRNHIRTYKFVTSSIIIFRYVFVIVFIYKILIPFQ